MREEVEYEKAYSEGYSKISVSGDGYMEIALRTPLTSFRSVESGSL